MLKLRDAENRHIDLPEGIVEVCDTDGNLAFAVYQDAAGKVVILEPGTPEGDRYARAFGVKWVTEHVTLPKFLTEVNV